MDRQINDIHIHIGKSSSIYQHFTDAQLLRFKITKDIQNILIFSTDLDTYKNNIIVKQLTAMWQFIYGLYWIDGYSPIEITDKMIGAKYHGAYTGKAIRPDWAPLQMLEEKEAVLMVHCGRYKEGAAESNTSYLHALDVAIEHPKIKVIMAHMGGTDTAVCKKAIHDSRDYDNVYFDTSGITTPYIIEYALTQIEPFRIIFGSDAPWCSFGAMVSTIEDSLISKDAKNLIFSENFLSLIKCKSILKQ